MLALSRLLLLQSIFAAAYLTYLVVSLVRRETTGEALSAAAIGPSIAMFVAYLGVLWLGRAGHVGWYRIGMIPALILFGGGGVAGNILRYFQSGLENYANVSAFLVAVLINGFGTVLNAVAALGLFKRDEALIEGLVLSLVLPDGAVYPHAGKLVSGGYTFDEDTQKITVWGEFPNPERLLRPGLRVTVRSEAN